MTRRSLCVFITALICALGVATTASAECAWVLWQEVPVASGGWSLDTGKEIAFPTKAACEKRLRARVQAFGQATTGMRPFSSGPRIGFHRRSRHLVHRLPAVHAAVTEATPTTT
jgi:hypothetical protein